MSTELLAGCRSRLDLLDEKLMGLVGERFEICREVANIKLANDIPMMQSNRVEEVKKRCVYLGQKYNVDSDFIERLYSLIIGEACRIQDEIIDRSEVGTDKQNK